MISDGIFETGAQYCHKLYPMVPQKYRLLTHQLQSMRYLIKGAAVITLTPSPIRGI